MPIPLPEGGVVGPRLLSAAPAPESVQDASPLSKPPLLICPKLPEPPPLPGLPLPPLPGLFGIVPGGTLLGGSVPVSGSPPDGGLPVRPFTRRELGDCTIWVGS